MRKTLHDLLKRKTFRTILVSYILVSFVPVIISIVVYSTAITTIRNQVTDMGNFSALQLKTQTDAALSKVIASAKTLSLDPTLRSQIDMTEDAGPAVRYETNRLSRYLGGYEQSRDQILNAFIFLSGSNSILSSNYRYNGDKAESLSAKEFGFGLHDLRNIVMNSPHGSVSFKQARNSDDSNLILVIQPVMSTNYLFEGAIIMTVDAEELVNISENVVFESGATFLLSPEKDYFVSESGSGSIKSDRVDNESDSAVSELLGYEVHTASSKSDVSGIIYATAIPVEEYYQPIRNIISFIIFYIILCLVFGAIAAFRAAKRSYSPIERMLKLTSSKHEGSEFQAIEQALRNASEKEKLYKRAESKQNENARNNVLAGMLKRRSGDAEYLSSILKLHNIDLSGGIYAVVSFYIDDYSNLFFGKEDIGKDEQYELTYIILRSIVEELLSPFSNTYVASIDSSISCIVCFNHSLEEDSAMQSLKETLDYATRFIEENFGLYILAAVSPLLRSVDDLPTGYAYALDTVEYATLTDQPYRCLLYSETAPDSFHAATGFLEKKRRLINLLIEGAYAEAHLTICDIIDSGMLSSQIGIHAVKRRMLLIINLLTEHFDSLKDTIDDNTFNLLNPAKELSSFKSTSDLRTVSQNYFFSLERSVSETEDDTDSLGIRIRSCIDENIQNQNLDITYISEKFGISQSYASRVFKQQTSSTILDYINAKRIEEAKRLLTTTNLSVKQISEQVGYRNPWTLSRTLRRIEGLSPVAYRETFAE